MDAEELAHVLERHGPGTREPGTHSLPDDGVWTVDRIERVVESLVSRPDHRLRPRRLNARSLSIFGVSHQILFRIIIEHRYGEAWGIGTVHPVNGQGVRYTDGDGRSRWAGPLDLTAVHAYADEHE